MVVYVSGLAALKQWLFLGRSAKLCVEATNRCDSLFCHEQLWSQVRSMVNQQLFRSSAKRDVYVKDHQSAARFILFEIAQVAQHRLASGDFHVSRGVVGRSGTSLIDVAELALGELHENHWLTDDQYEERRAHLRQMILNVAHRS